MNGIAIRRCGTCSACCRWPAVPEIKKAPRVPCEHLRACGHGCVIYVDRPKMCAEYRCAWLRGFGATGDQPDKCGVLIDRRMSQFGYVLVAKSLKPGAVRSKKGRRTIARIARQADMLCLVVADDDSRKVVGVAGPKKEVQRIKDEAKGQSIDVGNVEGFVSNLTHQVCEGQWPVM